MKPRSPLKFPRSLGYFPIGWLPTQAEIQEILPYTLNKPRPNTWANWGRFFVRAIPFLILFSVIFAGAKTDPALRGALGAIKLAAILMLIQVTIGWRLMVGFRRWFRVVLRNKATHGRRTRRIEFDPSNN